MRNEFDPHAYAITVRRMRIDGEQTFVARVAELPHVEVFESSGDAAYASAIDVINSLHQAAADHGRPFPDPMPADEPSGRFTLRMPPWLHARLERAAEREGTSLNAHINLILAAHQSASTVAADYAKVAAMRMIVHPQFAASTKAVAASIAMGNVETLQHYQFLAGTVTARDPV
jgi:hypothetical protein